MLYPQPLTAVVRKMSLVHTHTFEFDLSRDSHLFYVLLGVAENCTRSPIMVHLWTPS